MQLVSNAQVGGKKVLLRTGFDVPVAENGQITDTLRITQALPTINYLLEKEARLIILSHSGRPDGQLVSDDSLLPVAQYLELLLKKPIKFVTEEMEEKIQAEVNLLKNGEILMLENLRFHSGEESNDPRFSRWLAGLGDIFVNDAFSDAHRAHASMVGIPALLPSYAGFTLDKEVRTLTALMEKPDHPVVGIIGGAKLESKLPVITHLLPVVDTILIGSKFVGQKLPESNKIILPTDTLKDNAGAILDIGPNTINYYNQIIRAGKTIFWSGPLGKFEDPDYARGTEEIATVVAAHPGQTIIGGGDTISAFIKFGLLDQVKYVSTGGSAMLEYLAGKKLPGLEALI